MASCTVYQVPFPALPSHLNSTSTRKRLGSSSGSLRWRAVGRVTRCCGMPWLQHVIVSGPAMAFPDMSCHDHAHGMSCVLLCPCLLPPAPPCHDLP